MTSFLLECVMISINISLYNNLKMEHVICLHNDTPLLLLVHKWSTLIHSHIYFSPINIIKINNNFKSYVVDHYSMLVILSISRFSDEDLFSTWKWQMILQETKVKRTDNINVVTSWWLYQVAIQSDSTWRKYYMAILCGNTRWQHKVPLTGGKTMWQYMWYYQVAIFSGITK